MIKVSMKGVSSLKIQVSSKKTTSVVSGQLSPTIASLKANAPLFSGLGVSKMTTILICGRLVELGGVIIRSQGFGSGFAIYATDAAARVFSKFVELIAKSPELAP